MDRQSQPRGITVGIGRGVREVTSQSYATNGEEPHRQMLYDWAISGRHEEHLDNDDMLVQGPIEHERGGYTPLGQQDDPTERLAERTVSRTTGDARRDLERALSDYRRARNALRTTQGTAVPTASALRAYWNDEARSDNPQNGQNSEPFRSSMAELLRHDVARQRQEARVNENQMQGVRLGWERWNESGESVAHRQRYGATLHASEKYRRGPELSLRSRNTIRYLSDLRCAEDVASSMTLARALRIDALYSSKEENAPSDLPMSMHDLPVPQISSWLQPGMVWHGLQCAERERERGANLASTRMRERQREYLRRAIERRRLGVTADASALGVPGSITALLDAERYMSDLLEEDDNSSLDRWERSSIAAIADEARAAKQSEPDNWPVKVTLHSVNYETMMVSGTMTASHIPDRFSANSADHKAEGSSMESFFEGEIIDFRHHTLETEGRGYKTGGIDVDVRYWRGIGPLKDEMGNKARNNQPRTTESRTETGKTDVDAKDDASESEMDEKMARLLGSRRWVQEKLGEEWVLMRWKGEHMQDVVVTTWFTNSRDRTMLHHSRFQQPPAYLLFASIHDVDF